MITEREVIEKLLGKTFARTRNLVGHQIEEILGSSANDRPEADFDNWELKSREFGATSRITLGGKSGLKLSELEVHIWNKIKNTILVKYIVNPDKSFSVVEVIFYTGLEFSAFQASGYEYDNHHRNSALRITEQKFVRMFGTNFVRYNAPEWAR